MLTALLLLMALFLGVALFVAIYNFFEGETLLRDLFDEAKLRRASIQDMDKAWAIAPKGDCIISLTSLPSRLPHISLTLKSLLRQTHPPARIRLNLPAFSKRENTAYQVPDWIKDLQSVEIICCEDHGPASKLIPSLSLSATQKIIVVDDDRIYPANLLADLSAAADRAPDHALGFSGWVAPSDLTDRPTTVWTNLRMTPPVPIRARRLRQAFPVDIFQGFSGYLIRPGFFVADQVQNYNGAPPSAFFVDDIWLSAHCRAPIAVIPAKRAGYAPRQHKRFYRKTSLGRVNNGGGDVEKRNNTILLRYFATRWTVGGKPDVQQT